MSAPLSCPSPVQPARATGFALMLLHSCPGPWPPSSKLMTRPVLMTKTPLQLRQSLQLLQPHLERQCPSTAIRLPCLHHLTVRSHLRLLDWGYLPLDLSHPGAPAASHSRLIGLLLITSARHSDAQHCPAPLHTQLSHSRHSPSCRHSLLWSLTLDPTP